MDNEPDAKSIISTSSTKSVISQTSSSSSSSEGSGTINSSDKEISVEVVRRKSNDRKPVKKRSSSGSCSHSGATSNDTPPNIQYHGVNIYMASSQGSLPLCVLLWGMAAAKRVTLMVPDDSGNNPMHYAALADTAEVCDVF